MKKYRTLIIVFLFSGIHVGTLVSKPSFSCNFGCSEEGCHRKVKEIVWGKASGKLPVSLTIMGVFNNKRMAGKWIVDIHQVEVTVKEFNRNPLFSQSVQFRNHSSIYFSFLKKGTIIFI